MTETQRKFLTEYLGESIDSYWWCDFCKQELGSYNVTYEENCCMCGHPVIVKYSRTFAELKDKQDLLEAVIRKGEWDAFIVYIDWFSVVNPAYRFTKAQIVSFISWLIQLSPEATAELICKWKGVE